MNDKKAGRQNKFKVRTPLYQKSSESTFFGTKIEIFGHLGPFSSGKTGIILEQNLDRPVPRPIIWIPSTFVAGFLHKSPYLIIELLGRNWDEKHCSVFNIH